MTKRGVGTEPVLPLAVRGDSPVQWSHAELADLVHGGLVARAAADDLEHAV